MKDVEETLRQLHHMVTAATILQLTLYIVELYKHLQQKANKLSHICQSKRGIVLIKLLKLWMTCSNIMETPLDSLVCCACTRKCV